MTSQKLTHCLTLVLALLIVSLPCYTQNNLFYRDIELRSAPAYGIKGDFIKTQDGGILISVVSNDTLDTTRKIALIKLDSEGETLWEKEMLNMFGSNGIAEDVDGNLVIVCRDTLLHAVIVKTDQYGNVLWARSTESQSHATTVIAANSAYYLFGQKVGVPSWENDYVVAKFDHDGNLIWSKIYETGHADIFQEAIRTQNNDFLVVGRYRDEWNSIHYVHSFLITEDGTILWSCKYSFPMLAEIKDVVECPNGNFAYTGRMNGPGWEILYIQTDADGIPMYGSSYRISTFQEGYSIHPTEDNGYMLCIEPEGYLDNSVPQSALLKIEETGEVEYVMVYELSDLGSFPFGALREPESYLIMGIRNDNNNLWMIRTDLEGNLDCIALQYDISQEYISPLRAPEPIFAIGSIPFISIEIATVDLSISNNLICLDSIPGPPPEHYLPNVPNVFSPDDDGINDLFEIDYPIAENYSLKITNRWGKLVFESNHPAISWNGKIFNVEENASAGVYFYLITVGHLSRHGTVTLIR